MSYDKELKELFELAVGRICVYGYENLINGKMYIGQSCNLRKRHGTHISVSKKHNPKGINAAIRKYSIDEFRLFIVRFIDTDNEADQEERFWIAEMRRLLGRENVYNMADGGKNQRGMAGPAHPMYGKTMPQEVCKKISNSLKGENHPLYGTKLPEEWAHNIAQAKMGEKNPNFGKKVSKTTRAKLSMAHKEENNGRAKLTNKDVIKIKKLLTKGKMHKMDIAKKFNISRCTINDIQMGRSWKNV